MPSTDDRGNGFDADIALVERLTPTEASREAAVGLAKWLIFRLRYANAVNSQEFESYVSWVRAEGYEAVPEGVWWRVLHHTCGPSVTVRTKEGLVRMRVVSWPDPDDIDCVDVKDVPGLTKVTK